MVQITLTLPNATRQVNIFKLRFAGPFLKSAGSDPKTCFWPLKPADVPDRRDLKLVFLSPLHPYLGRETIPFVNELSSLSDKGFRRFKKTMLLVAMEEREAARMMLDVSSSEPGFDVDTILSSYKFVGYLGHKGIRWKILGHVEHNQALLLTRKIMDFAVSEKILLRRISPRILAKHLGLNPGTPYRISELFDRLLSEPKLPMIESAEVFLDALTEGVRTGIFEFAGAGKSPDLVDILKKSGKQVRFFQPE